MSALETFTFPTTGATVRTIAHGEDVWFIGRDAALTLEYTNPRKAIRDHVPAAQRRGNETFPLADLGLDPQTVLISESGLYRLIMRSDAPAAERFQEWVTDEVLPTLRKTGRYETAPAPQADVSQLDRRSLAQMVIAAEDAREVAEQRAAELEPRAESWDALASADGDWLVRDAAKVLSRDPMISIGERRLFGYMEHLRWIYRQPSDRRWRAYQAQVDTGRLVERAMSRPDPDGGDRHIEAPQVRITPKGLHELRQRLNGADPLPIKGVA